MPKKRIILLILCALLSIQGCATFDGLAVRRDDATRFLSDMEARTAAALEEHTLLSLDTCIDIALENNHDIKTAELEQRLAKLNRRVAFANFLPEVTFEYTYTELDRAPATALFGSLETTMQDRIVRDTAMQAQMPIFAPATWFLYALHRRGEELSHIAADYTRQMIALQVTGLYFQCLATEAVQEMLQAQRNAAVTLAHEIEAYHAEGLVTDADLAEVRVLVIARENALEMNKRTRQLNYAELLSAMGLAPTASVELDAAPDIAPPAGALEDWMLTALLEHPRLGIADRLVAIEEEKARIAITEFLPALAGFASRSHSSNSFMAYPYVTAHGFAGVMSVFTGFANVNEYRAARVAQEQAFLAREQESLSVMLEVVRAHIGLSDGKDNVRLANAAATATEAKLREEKAKMKEGLLRPSEMLNIVARHNEAQANVINARYQKQVMTAIARNALGATYFEESKEQEAEEDSNQ